MNIKQIKKEVLEGKIETFSTLNFYKVVYINYKNGPCVRIGPFDNGEKFYNFVRFLNEHKIKFYLAIFKLN